ncbi:MAG: class II glutamine amidotransferase [Archangium sp.]|nr:class II glutamine amidotransferase [Archangium sp.]
MCRLFAVLSESPVAVDRAFDALKRQAVEHKDGWGIARFDDGEPTVEVNTVAAHACTRFAELGSSLTTRSLLTHIRLASVGAVTPANAHPFTADGLAFMHNGTLRHFADHRAKFDELLAPGVRARLRGETDSERCFALFLTTLGATPQTVSLPQMMSALATVVRTAEKLCDDPADATKSSMNFMVSNGRWLVATRRGRTLFHTHWRGARYLASEPLWPDSPWHEVTDDTMVVVEPDLTLREVQLRDVSPLPR